MKTKPILYW